MKSHFQLLLCVTGLCGVAPAQTVTLQSLSPSTIPAGSSNLTLTVTGSNFPTGCVINWAGFPLTPTNCSSATQATVTVPQNFLTTPGPIAVTVLSPPGTGSEITSQTQFLTFTITPPLVTITSPNPLPPGTVGSNYNITLMASGGTGPGTYTWTGTSLPLWLTLDPKAGTLSGTPPTAGQFSFTIQVADSSTPPLTNTQVFTLNIASAGGGGGLTITTSSLPGATGGQAYTTTLMASGGTGPYTWSAAPGTSLPTWLTLTATTGVLSGTPPTTGTFSISVQVTDSALHTATQSFSLVVSASSPAPLTITSGATLPPGTAGAVYSSVSLTATGGTQPYTWSLASGSTLPTGLTLSPGGVLSGTPATGNQYCFTIQVADSSSPQLTASQIFSLSVSGSGSATLAIATCSLPPGTPGLAYTATLTASGGTPPYTWSGTSLPSWLTLDNAGNLSGTPPSAGTFSFAVQVQDSASNTASRTFSLSVAPLMITTTSPLPNGMVNVAYSPITFAASGGMGPYTFVVFSGNTDGLAFGTDNVTFSGTPQAAGTFTFIVQVADSTGLNAMSNFTLTVTGPGGGSPLTISTSSLPNASAGQAYTATLTASGGTAPYTWSAAPGAPLPSWMMVNASSGALSGTPSGSGSFTISVQVTDSTAPTARTASRTFTLVVVTGITITTASPLPAGVVGAAYSPISFSASGGTGPYTFVVSSGNTDGLAFGTDNITFSGTPPTAGTFNFTVQVTDSTGLTGSKAFAVTVSASSLPLQISSANQLPDAKLGAAYAYQMAATGGTAPYTWSAIGLPAGLTISSSGLISGTVGTAGALTFVVKVTDSAQPSAIKSDNFHLNVNAPPLPAIIISGLPATAAPLMQYTVTVGVASAYPVNITGTAILSSAPADNGPGDGSVQFSAGGKSANFTLNAGSTSTTLAIQAGSVAGILTLTLSQLSAGGTDVTPTPAPSAKTQMAAAAPVITAATASKNASTNTLTIQITGYATSREITQAEFTFTAATGQTLQAGASSLTIQLSSLFSSYFQNSQNASTGSQFVFSQPFTIQGDINSVIPQNVTLTNRVGSTTLAVTSQ